MWMWRRWIFLELISDHPRLLSAPSPGVRFQRCNVVRCDECHDVTWCHDTFHNPWWWRDALTLTPLISTLVRELQLVWQQSLVVDHIYRIQKQQQTIQCKYTLFKICHSMLSTEWQDHTICLSLFDTFFQNLSLPLIGWHSCQLSVSLPALPPAQASTLDMLSSYMDRTIVRHKFSLTFCTKN